MGAVTATRTWLAAAAALLAFGSAVPSTAANEIEIPAILPLGTAKTSAIDAASHPQGFFTQPGPKAA